MAAREGRLARPVLLQILDNARRLGLTAAETRVFETAIKTKAPAAPIAVDPRTILVLGPKWDWADNEHAWLNSDEFRRHEALLVNSYFVRPATSIP